MRDTVAEMTNGLVSRLKVVGSEMDIYLKKGGVLEKDYTKTKENLLFL